MHVVSPAHVKRCTTGARRVTGQLYAAGRTDTPLRMQPAQPVGPRGHARAATRARGRRVRARGRVWVCVHSMETSGAAGAPRLAVIASAGALHARRLLDRRAMPTSVLAFGPVPGARCSVAT